MAAQSNARVKRRSNAMRKRNAAAWPAASLASRVRPCPETGGATGVFLSIFMVMIIVVSMGVTYDTLVAKQAARELDGYVDALCAEVVQATPLVQRRAVQAFRRYVAGDSALGLQGTRPAHSTLTAAWLGLATMPANGSFPEAKSVGNYLQTSGPDSPDLGGAPTAPAGGVGFGSIAPDLGCDVSAGPGGTSSPATPLTGDCLFFGVFHATGTPLVQTLPIQDGTWRFVDDRVGAGNTVICHVAATVPTFYFSTKTITAKSVWNLAPTSGAPLPPEDLTGSDLETYAQQVLTGAGLTIAIAPHMVTPSLGNAWPIDWNVIRHFGFSALTNDGSGELSSLRNDADPEMLYSTGSLSPPAFPFGSEVQGADFHLGGATYQQPPFSAPSGNATAAARIRNDLAVSCLNPAVLVRNIFLSMLVELAARNGMLRNATEILLAGTQNRSTAYHYWTGSPSPPVKIVEFSEDLAAQKYVHPYVWFNAGFPIADYPDVFPVPGATPSGTLTPTPTPDADSTVVAQPTATSGPMLTPTADSTVTVVGTASASATAAPAETPVPTPLVTPPVDPGYPDSGFDGDTDDATEHNDGWVNPFNAGWGAAGADTQRWQKFYALLATQLRACYHLYRGVEDGQVDGAARYGGPVFNEILNNTQFEPASYQTNRATSLAPPGIKGWDSTCTCDGWGGTCSWGLEAGCDDTTYRLTAAAVVATLGTIQICPAALADDSDPNNYLRFCEKPTKPENDIEWGDGSRDNPRLRADLVALFRYLEGKPMGPAGKTIDMWYQQFDAGATTMFAYRSPGFWLKDYMTTMAQTTQAELRQRITTTDTQMGSENSHVVLVLHAPPLGDEVTVLRNLVAGFFGTNPQRQLTVVYFPTTRRDADLVGNVMDAFWADPADNRPSVLLAFNPYDTLVYGDRYTSLGDEAAVFAGYWTDLLMNPEAHVARRAEWLMTTRILKPQLRY